jgi:hypothetical protein
MHNFMIHLLRKRATAQQIQEMLEALDIYIKLAVDMKRRVLAGGGALHADCEAVLLEDGSNQSDIWGADWIPKTEEIKYEAFINIRPAQNNRAMTIQDKKIRHLFNDIVCDIFGEK